MAKKLIPLSNDDAKVLMEIALSIGLKPFANNPSGIRVDHLLVRAMCKHYSNQLIGKISHKSSTKIFAALFGFDPNRVERWRESGWSPRRGFFKRKHLLTVAIHPDTAISLEFAILSEIM